MERPNLVNPTYVDTRKMFAAFTTEKGQTSYLNRIIPTQNPSGATQFIAHEYVEPQTSGVESSNPVGRPPRNAPTTKQGDEFSQ